MNGRVTITRSAGIAEVRLSRADKLNAIDGPMFDALEQAAHSLATMPDLRAIVISGEGRAFCAGLDLQNFSTMAGNHALPWRDLAERTHGEANQAQHVVLAWREIPVPVIAAIHGLAFGGGFQLALGADIRIAAPDTRLSIMEIKWGLIPDMGGIALMRRLARADVIRELTFSGREFSGTEAQAFGLVTRLAPQPREAAISLAEQIAVQSPDAIRAAKRLLRLSDHAGEAEVLLAESIEQQHLIGSANQTEAIHANLEGRAPRFVDNIEDSHGMMK
ncbi:MAG: crotonase/enoyl-CoA hydratase family protein [Pseudomonadota bacterium]|jgi:enoyl-CoA hydratase/carnithine racemase|uniref:crotonase/enoyl-CoA hydratase family protein n=1 Tax=Sphingomonas sp. 67-41 TaxID=1895850 RepID=UPI000961FAF5|nr:crotonase/enoyl-CoA hydratase family protein [Sphingomonas sp. 67-41]OJY51748.1 MAG: enoyl-CoA hydratase [Sphingomonas sp. 67-41]|tara:strand:- start:1026 stop:1853 length:828 start_codon:yes stop_codon:yes gene_type:complete